MIPSLTFPHQRSGSPKAMQASAIWAVSAQLRRQITDLPDRAAIDPDCLLDRCACVAVNDRTIAIAWDCTHAVHDEAGRPVFGVCETDPDCPDTAFVSVNGPCLEGRPDLALSTIGHELGHVVFDVPPALCATSQNGQRYQSFTTGASALLRGEGISEWRANEFMGALLAPPYRLHRELLHYARSERLSLIRAVHSGRPAWPVVAADNDPDALAGVMSVIADEFGVSPRFIEVRLGRYGLIQNRMTGGVS